MNNQLSSENKVSDAAEEAKDELPNKLLTKSTNAQNFESRNHEEEKKMVRSEAVGFMAAEAESGITKTPIEAIESDEKNRPKSITEKSPIDFYGTTEAAKVVPTDSSAMLTDRVFKEAQVLVKGMFVVQESEDPFEHGRFTENSLSVDDDQKGIT